MGREHFLKEVEDKKEEKSTLRGEWVVGRGIKKSKGGRNSKKRGLMIIIIIL